MNSWGLYVYVYMMMIQLLSCIQLLQPHGLQPVRLLYIYKLSKLSNKKKKQFLKNRQKILTDISPKKIHICVCICICVYIYIYIYIMFWIQVLYFLVCDLCLYSLKSTLNSACSLSHVQLFCNPMECSLPGFSVHGIFQARILEQVAISYSRGCS